MWAWVLHGVNDIRYEDIDVPVCEDEEVLVRVCAAGICGSDIPRVYDTGAHKMPLVIGHEFAGIVESVGKGVSGDWTGMHVGVFPLIPCRKCVPCKNRQYEMCRNYDYIGSRRDGAFAEYVAVPERNLISLPDSLSFESAAMLEPMAVAVHAMRKGTDNLKRSRDCSIVVCGLGTIGLLLVMFLQDAGYKNLSVIGNKEFQRREAALLGLADNRYIDSHDEQLLSKLRNMGGMDIYFECVGKNECLSYGIEGAAPGGTVVLIGNPYTDMKLPRDIYWKILRNQMSLCGTWNSTFTHDDEDDWHYVISRVCGGNVRPTELITHRLQLDKLAEGLSLMKNKNEDYCKVMILRYN